MPHLPGLGSFPLILRDYMVPDPRKGELLLNYENNELYFVRKSTGEVISIARNIYDKILATKIKNNRIVVYDADKLNPQPGRDEIVPAVKDREYNAFYFIVAGRRTYVPGEDHPLTAPTWAVKSGKKFLGKNSGYVEEEEEG